MRMPREVVQRAAAAEVGVRRAVADSRASRFRRDLRRRHVVAIRVREARAAGHDRVEERRVLDLLARSAMSLPWPMKISCNDDAAQMTCSAIGRRSVSYVSSSFARALPFHDERELPAQVVRVLHAAVHALPARRRMHVRGIAREEHVARSVRLREPHVALPLRVPDDLAELHVVEVLVDEPHEALLGRHVRIRGLAAVAEQHPVEAARQLHDHDEVVGAGAVVHLVVGVGEAFQERVHVL